MRLLAIGAHPDDIEIYMAGMLFAAKFRGDHIALAIATDGSKGGAGTRKSLADKRRFEATAAGLILGESTAFLDFEDGALVADAALIAALRDLIGETMPDLIVTHAPNDYHGDHRALSDAVRTAANFQAPVLWADTMQGVGFAPTHYVDITAEADRKAGLIRVHVSQDPERFVTMARQLNSFRAAQANQPDGSQAEAYRFEPQFPFVDIRDLLPPAPPIRPIGDRRKRQT